MNPYTNAANDLDDLNDEIQNYDEYNEFHDETEPAVPFENLDPKAQLLEDLQSQMYSLILSAETVLMRQSRQTQLALRKETKDLFTSYESHGSMARLKLGVHKFLTSGDADGTLSVEEECPRARNNRPAHYGAAFNIDYTSRDDEPKFDARTDFITPLVPDTTSANPTTTIHPLRTVDPESIPLVTTLPWDPIATRMQWPGSLRLPRGLLSSLNKILSIVDYESRNRLFHHITKYGPSPVFRAGLAQKLKADYGSIFETATENYLGLTPETRSFLRSMYFKKPHLNVAERRLLALACRVEEDSVQMFWEDLSESTKSWQAMRIFMAAREIELDREAEKWEKGKKRMRDHEEYARGFEEGMVRREEYYERIKGHDTRQRVLRESAEEFRRVRDGEVEGGLTEVGRQFSS
jgi:hypothetical protein